MKNFRIVSIIMIMATWSCNESGEIQNKDTVKHISTAVNAIAIDKANTVWIATNDSLYKGTEEGYKHVKLSVTGKIYSLFYETPSNILWIGTETALIQASVTNGELSEKVINNSNLSYPKVNTLYIDNNSRYWFGTDKGFCMKDGDTWKKDNFRISNLGKLFAITAEDYPINSIASIDGSYYFATSGNKLWRAFGFDESVDAFSGATQWSPPYNGENITDTMFAVLIDKEGRQWMGGKSGIQVHAGQDPKGVGSFTYYNVELPDAYVLDIKLSPDGNIWAATRKGIAVFNGSSWETISSELPHPHVTAIAFETNGSAWIGTKKGVVHVE